MRLKSKYGKGYWLLQLLSWGILMVMNFWVKAIKDSEITSLYFFIEGILFFIIGILSTHAIRRYFQKIRLVENQSVANYFKSIIAVFIAGIVFTAALISMAHLAFAIIELSSKLNMSFEEILLNYLNLTLFTLFWSIMYLVIKSSLRLRNEKIRRLELEAALKEAQLNTLKGQINPHFMFNSLNNIRGLILEDPAKSREMLTRLSEMLRASLNSDKTDTITIAQELETVNNFIALSKIQMEKRLQYIQEVDETVLDAQIPPMVLQLLVENAIKHGISTLPDGGTVKLSIFRKGGSLLIEVSNDGLLLSGGTGTSVGIKNIKDRLSILYDGQADFSLNFKDGKVTATIQLPLATIAQ